MQKLLATITLAMLSLTTFAHSDKELGPNGGRILEFSTDQSMHGEVTLTNGTFFVALLDKDMKSVPITDQSLTVTGGSRTSPEKPAVEKRGNLFAFPALKGDSYLLVFQFKPNQTAKPITARFEYDSAICGTCKKGEWLCDCHLKSKKQNTGTDKPGAKH
ncbi:MAG TPA: hypothetical protein VF773_03435 [Verrucomicrobiae bacterium]